MSSSRQSRNQLYVPVADLAKADRAPRLALLSRGLRDARFGGIFCYLESRNLLNDVIWIKWPYRPADPAQAPLPLANVCAVACTDTVVTGGLLWHPLRTTEQQ